MQKQRFVFEKSNFGTIVFKKNIYTYDYGIFKHMCIGLVSKIEYYSQSIEAPSVLYGGYLIVFNISISR